MPSKRQTKSCLEALIKDFEISGMDKNTTEANVCHYVDRLFQCLGWDIGTVYEYDRESYVRGAGLVDRGLKIENEPIFFCEVKRIGAIISSQERRQRGIDRTDEEKQAIRYARSSTGQFHWAILTNFERLVVFNADREVEVMSFDSPSDYLKQSEDIWVLRKGPTDDVYSVDRRLRHREEQRRKEERAEEVDDDYLEKLERWRLNLGQTVLGNNRDNAILLNDSNEVDVNCLQDAARRFLDRLVVIQFLVDNDVIEDDILKEILETYRRRRGGIGRYSLLADLRRTFKALDEKHNTEIFAFGHPCDKIALSDEVVASILREICDTSFRKFESDILGSTYETHLATQLTIEKDVVQIRGKELGGKRKEQEIYYTPNYVVKFIVGYTLGRHLYGTENGQPDGTAIKGQKRKTVDEIRDLKVLDPACGSGSFLLYAFEVLAKFYRDENERIRREMIQLDSRGSKDYQEAARRATKPIANYPKKILEDHLYGVDLDPEATEIATVNLIMAAFKEARMIENFDGELPLILNQNIKTGNSLISGVKDCGELSDHKDAIRKIIDLRNELRNALSRDDEADLLDRIKNATASINNEVNQSLDAHFSDYAEHAVFNWQAEFPEVFFNNDGTPRAEPGFQVVIGNPPYIMVSNLVPAERDYFMASLQTAMKRFDIFIGFIEKGIELLSPSAAISFIVPYPFLSQDNAEKIRKFMLENGTVSDLIDLRKFKVFKEAAVRNCIFIFSKSEVTDAQTRVTIPEIHPRITGKIEGDAVITSQNWYQETPGNMFRLELNEKTRPTCSKIEDVSIPAGNIIVASWGARGVPIEEFHLDSPINDLCKKMIKGENVEQYCVDYSGKWFLYDKSKLYRPSVEAFFTNAKVVVKKVTGEEGITSSLDDEMYYTDDSLICCVKKEAFKGWDLNELRRHKIYVDEGDFTVSKDYDMKYFLGIMNSSLCNFYFKVMLGYGLNVYPESIEKIPIRKIDFSHPSEKKLHDDLCNMVSKMLDKMKQSLMCRKLFAGILQHQAALSEGFVMGTLRSYVDNWPSYGGDIARNCFPQGENVRGEVNSRNAVEILSARADTADEEECLTLRARYNDKDGAEQFDDVAKLYNSDEAARQFLYLCVRKFLDDNKNKQRWTQPNERIVPKLFSTIKIPYFHPDTSENLQTIRKLMENYQGRLSEEGITSNLVKLESEVTELDKEIDTVVYRLYGFEPDTRSGKTAIKLVQNILEA